MSDRIRRSSPAGAETAPQQPLAVPLPVELKELSVTLALDHWRVIHALLEAAPYVRAKPIIEAIDRQVKDADAVVLDHLQRADHRANEAAAHAAHERDRADNAQHRVSVLEMQLESQERLRAENARLREQVRAAKPKAPRKRGRPRKQANGAKEQPEVTP